MQPLYRAAEAGKYICGQNQKDSTETFFQRNADLLLQLVESFGLKDAEYQPFRIRDDTETTLAYASRAQGGRGFYKICPGRAQFKTLALVVAGSYQLYCHRLLIDDSKNSPTLILEGIPASETTSFRGILKHLKIDNFSLLMLNFATLYPK
jgi:hypothetical protein